MPYSLVYTKKAIKDIKKLDSVTKKRLRQALEKFSQNPIGYSKKLISSELGEYRFRVGNYRIIFDLSGKKIIILRIGHRREIYK